MEYNIYCDESCHLEKDHINSMSIGAIYCQKEKVKEINENIIRIKARHGITKTSEVKWTKISTSNVNLYKDLIDYFFHDDDLHFRCVIIKDKQNLNHVKFNQTHDQWYYKMYFEMLRVIFSPRDSHFVYIDIKDTNSHYKAQELLRYVRNDRYDFKSTIIKRIQPIRSHEVQIMQIVDIFVGAMAYANREFGENEIIGEAKKEICNYIKRLSGYSLTKTTLLKEQKVNLLAWEAYHGM